MAYPEASELALVVFYKTKNASQNEKRFTNFVGPQDLPLTRDKLLTLVFTS